MQNGGTDAVIQALPPTMLSCPITVSPPRIVCVGVHHNVIFQGRMAFMGRHSLLDRQCAQRDALDITSHRFQSRPSRRSRCRFRGRRRTSGLSSLSGECRYPSVRGRARKAAGEAADSSRGLVHGQPGGRLWRKPGICENHLITPDGGGIAEVNRRASRIKVS